MSISVHASTWAARVPSRSTMTRGRRLAVRALSVSTAVQIAARRITVQSRRRMTALASTLVVLTAERATTSRMPLWTTVRAYHIHALPSAREDTARRARWAASATLYASRRIPSHCLDARIVMRPTIVPLRRSMMARAPLVAARPPPQPPLARGPTMTRRPPLTMALALRAAGSFLMGRWRREQRWPRRRRRQRADDCKCLRRSRDAWHRRQPTSTRALSSISSRIAPSACLVVWTLVMSPTLRMPTLMMALAMYVGAWIRVRRITTRARRRMPATVGIASSAASIIERSTMWPTRRLMMVRASLRGPAARRMCPTIGQSTTTLGPISMTARASLWFRAAPIQIRSIMSLTRIQTTGRAYLRH